MDALTAALVAIAAVLGVATIISGGFVLLILAAAPTGLALARLKAT